MSADTSLMPIPGMIDPVPVTRDITPRADGRVDLIGLPRTRIVELFAEAGLDPRQAKLRAKQVFHWLYHRGVTDFAAMSEFGRVDVLVNNAGVGTAVPATRETPDQFRAVVDGADIGRPAAARIVAVGHQDDDLVEVRRHGRLDHPLRRPARGPPPA